MKIVEMPPYDGAPYGCTLLVQVPRPLFWDKCRQTAVTAYKDNDGRLYFRCKEHWSQLPVEG